MTIAIIALCTVAALAIHAAVTRPICRRMGWA